MTLHTTGRPSVGQKAALLIFEEGPMQRADLFSRVDFGVSNKTRLGALDRSIVAGWLEERGNIVDITQGALEYFEAEQSQASAKKTKGSVAAPRDINMMQRPPYVPPKRVPRDDEPQWSKRPAGFGFCTIA